MDPSAEPVQRERSKRALIVTALAAGIAGACSHSSRGQADGGLTGAGRGSGENAPGAPLAGRHSFDVLATLSLGDVVPPSSLQSPVPFTLVLDADAGLAFVGALGGAAELPVTKGASGDLGLGDFSVNVASPISTSIDFTSLLIAANNAALNGRGAGQAIVFCGDCANFNEG